MLIVTVAMIEMKMMMVLMVMVMVMKMKMLMNKTGGIERNYGIRRQVSRLSDLAPMHCNGR